MGRVHENDGRGRMSQRVLADEHLEKHLEEHITKVLDAQIDPYIDSILNTFTEIVQSQQSNLIKSYLDIEKKVSNNSRQVVDLDNTKAEVDYVEDLLKTVLVLSKSMEAQIQDHEEHINKVEAITARLASLNASFSDLDSSVDEWQLNSSSIFNNFTTDVKTKQSQLEQKLSRLVSEKMKLTSDFSDLEKKVGNLTKSLLYGDLLTTSGGYSYYKTPVPFGKKLVTGTVAETCGTVGLRAVCSGPAGCSYTSSRCLVTPLSTDCGNDMRPISKLICNRNNPRLCSKTEGMFSDTRGRGYDCGAVRGGGWCANGNSYTSTTSTPYFAYCVKAP